MKLVGLITEYNPFHNGHQYHIEQALKVTGSDAAVVIMSGDFVQRGAPCLLPKHLRVEAALRSGAALVIELPCMFATASAEYFARGAVSILHNLGCIDSLCFGSENADIRLLTEVADLLIQEPDDFKKLLKDGLKQGLPFPLARKNALCSYLGREEVSSLLDKPNQILGIEYIKALRHFHSTIKPVAILRQESDYHDHELTGNFSSATAIRELFQGEYDTRFYQALEKSVPDACNRLIRENLEKRLPVSVDDYSLLLRYKLLSQTKESLLTYLDVTEDLANRILRFRNEFKSWSLFCELLKTKDVTYTRISRILCHILLDIKKTDMARMCATGYGKYAHVLGFRKDCSNVLKEFKLHSSIPVLTRSSQFKSSDPVLLAQLERDIFASNLYESVLSDKFSSAYIPEQEKKIIIV